MTKGTASFGRRGRAKTHIRCRRCGRRSYHIRWKRCAACGFGAMKKLRGYSWQTHTLNRDRRIR
ncbi:MAG TPA: 50S ribosomal protein L37e [Candidatus Bathyarchaeia archaeon]|nr:50S ribosomal protein L37e [Candidatus Bathyarchaeia archaeon]